LGYDHAESADEKVMFALQEDLVKKHEALAWIPLISSQLSL
jgi:ssRNA-specific RNase YbeY (16S rRNA maturation enzyme)